MVQYTHWFMTYIMRIIVSLEIKSKPRIPSVALEQKFYKICPHTRERSIILYERISVVLKKKFAAGHHQPLIIFRVSPTLAATTRGWQAAARVYLGAFIESIFFFEISLM